MRGLATQRKVQESLEEESERFASDFNRQASTRLPPCHQACCTRCPLLGAIHLVLTDGYAYILPLLAFSHSKLPYISCDFPASPHVESRAAQHRVIGDDHTRHHVQDLTAAPHFNMRFSCFA